MSAVIMRWAAREILRRGAKSLTRYEQASHIGQVICHLSHVTCVVRITAIAKVVG